jgi:hypothetical protein
MNPGSLKDIRCPHNICKAEAVGIIQTKHRARQGTRMNNAVYGVCLEKIVEAMGVGEVSFKGVKATDLPGKSRANKTNHRPTLTGEFRS